MAKKMDDAARCWLQACDVIKTLLRELRPDLTAAQLDHNASAVIARLASHDPPLLIAYATEIKD